MAEVVRLPSLEYASFELDAYVVRAWRDGDARQIGAAYRDDPEIPRRTGFAFGMTEAQALAYIRLRREEWRRGSTAAFGIFDREGQLLGSISLLSIDGGRGEAEVGFWLARGARGRGLAVAAVRWVSGWAFGLGLNRLSATVEVGNAASLKVMESAGFCSEGVRSSHRELHGERIDECLWSLHRPNPPSQEAPEFRI